MKRSSPLPARKHKPKKAVEQTLFSESGTLKKTKQVKAKTRKRKADVKRASKKIEVELEKVAKREGAVENAEPALLERPKPIWQPHPGVQTEFLKSNEDEVLFSGGRGSGKSDCLIVDALRYCANGNFRGLIIRRTVPCLPISLSPIHVQLHLG